MRRAFATAKANEYATGNLSPDAPSLAGNICLIGDAPHQTRFKALFRKNGHPNGVEFLIVPTKRYALSDFVADRTALLSVNRMLASHWGQDGAIPSLFYGGFDEDGEPVGRVSVGPLSMRYLMRDRIRSAVDDLFSDKICFFETVFESLHPYQAGGLSEYAAVWAGRVNAIVDEELDRRRIDRTHLEKQIRVLNMFLRNIRRRTAMPGMW
ncbi:hypothetical protein [Methanofollis fontis]|uniref:Uncharacterized protein n=1 Tax=Methanofollis fontis TaxID=2052832 RepID=A0A483CR88_9EURY|nr:hypothetical protein [Methanofollis fontis]TAJ43473.1 hypothetical protein CUJ86_10815 [Methanofollis fontis]